MSRFILAILCAASLASAQQSGERKRVVPYPVFEHRGFTRAV